MAGLRPEVGHEPRESGQGVEAEGKQFRLGGVELGGRGKHSRRGTPGSGRRIRIDDHDALAALRAPPGHGRPDHPCTEDGDVARGHALSIVGCMAARGLGEARLYLCVDSRAHQGDLAEFLDAVLVGGVDVVQLREKGLEARAEMAALEVFAAAAERHGALFAVNDRADIARAAGAPILHLGQDDLPVDVARAIVGPDVAIGRSTHTPDQLAEAAGAVNVDYFCCGPVWSTPTKPGRPAAGLDLVGSAAAYHVERPWFAIGGIESVDRLDEVIARGARRVVVVRAITEADDPGAAARTFASRLRAVT